MRIILSETQTNPCQGKRQYSQVGNSERVVHKNRTYEVLTYQRHLNGCERLMRILAIFFSYLTIIPAVAYLSRMKEFSREIRSGIETKVIFTPIASNKPLPPKDEENPPPKPLQNPPRPNSSNPPPLNPADTELHPERVLVPLSYEEILPGYQVLSVLEQQALDGGKETCAFHALKNALLMLQPEAQQNHCDYLDENLFSTFYFKYCSDLLEGKDEEQRDGSICLLRAIIQEMLNDPAPSEEHAPLIAQFRNAQEEFAILNFVSESGKLHVRDDVFRPFQLAHIQPTEISEVFKLYDFAKKQGPAQLTTVSGATLTGHWYTLQIHKKADGNVDFIGCDSMHRPHNALQEQSSIYKIGEAIKECLKNPEELLTFAYDDFFHTFAHMNAAFNKLPEESDPDYQNRLQDYFLDGTPTDLVAVEGVHDGSNREMKLYRIIQAMRIVEKGNWLQSQNAAIQNHLQILRNLVDYYHDHLENTDRQYGEIERIHQLLHG